MKTFTPEELKAIIEKHGKWVRDEEGGSRANLSGANLSYANLSDAKLSGADLSDANLSRSCLDPQHVAALRAFHRGQKGRVLFRSQVGTLSKTEYACGKTYVAPWFSSDMATDCHPGLYACATIEEAKKHAEGATIVRVYARAGEYIVVPGKGVGVVRAKRMRILGVVE